MNEGGQILKISHFQNNSNKPSEEEEQRENMAIPDILVNIGTALDRVETYIGGDTTINPINTLNGIRISLTTIREHMRNVANEATQNLNRLHTANRHNGELRRNLITIRNDLNRRERMWDQAWRDERQAR